MNSFCKIKVLLSLCLLALISNIHASEELILEGVWEVTSIVRAENQVRYTPQGYMVFSKKHWFHFVFFNRDQLPEDFAEAHHGTYRITASGTVDLNVDMELHADAKKEFQSTPVWFGEPGSIQGARFRMEGEQMILDFPSTMQLVLQRAD